MARALITFIIPMLSKQHRLKKTMDFARALKSGRAVRQGALLLKASRTPNAALRIGIVVSKKVAAKATQRNRIRRMLSEATRALLPELREGFDVAVIVLPGFRARRTQDAKALLAKLFSRAVLTNK